MATILIVDTNPTDRRSYITLLGNFGHRLLEADDGVQALELARAELPDLIITDILMPQYGWIYPCAPPARRASADGRAGHFPDRQL